MSEQADKAARFLELHRTSRPLLLPNPWDAGSAKVLEWLGFEALATTSGGSAATLGRRDYSVSRDEALALATVIVEASSLPVTADLENGFADEPEGVAETVRGALAAGLAGCSIEDSTGRAQEPIYELAAASERIAAAVEVAHAGPVHLVLSARAENYLHGRPDLEDTIARLQAYEAAGADVLYAPGVVAGEDIAAIVAAVQRPVNVLARPGMPSVDELAALGVSRISVGSAFAFAAIDALVEAARELREQGTYGFAERSARGMAVSRDAFAPPGE